MSKKFKRAIGLMLCSLVLISAFSGCGTKKEDKNSQSVLSTIKVWTNSSSTKELMTQLVNEYNNTTGKTKGIAIDYKVYGDDYQQVINLAIKSGQSPELFYVVGQKIPQINQGNIMPINDLPDSQVFLDKYKEFLRPVSNIIDGKIYSVPYNVETIGLLYNKDLFKKHGIVDEKGEAKPPVTWDEMIDYAKKMTNEADKTYGIALPMKWAGYYKYELALPYISSIGHSYFDNKNGKFNYSEFKPVFEWLLKIKNDKSYFPGAEGLDNDPARAQFAEGRIAMKFGAVWDVGVLNDQFPAKIDWGVAKIPFMNKDGNKYKQFMTGADFLCVSQTAKNSDTAKVMEVYKWFNSDEVLTKMYEDGKIIPYNPEIIKKAKASAKKGWTEFASMVSDSYPSMEQPAITLEGADYKQVMSKIWAGTVSIEEGLADLDKRYNYALDKGISGGSIDLKMYTDEKLDNKIK